MKVELKYLRKEKAEEMSFAYKRGIEKRSDLKIETYENAVILPGKHIPHNHAIGGVADQDGNYIRLSENFTYGNWGGGYMALTAKSK